MILIYRIEHKDTGTGPFQSDSEFSAVLCEKTSGPLPYDDGITMSEIPWYWKFGCTTIDILKTWFTLKDINFDTVINTLDREGFILVEYIVNSGKYLISNTGSQVVFDADDIDTVARRKKLKNLLNATKTVL